MNRPIRLLLLLASLAGVAIPSASAQPAPAPGVEGRLDERLPKVAALKASGLVGENNRGLLEPRGALSPDDARVVEAENIDRSRVYATVAERSGVAVDEVARSRARQIAQRSPAGLWLQAPDGAWYRKP